MSASTNPKTILITDLDNTLWDWFEAWHQSFSAMLVRLSELSGIPQPVLESQIRPIHQARGTSEYSNLLNEVPALRDAAGDQEPAVVFDEALHVLHSRRKESTRLYPTVSETLGLLRQAGVLIVAYTESVAYWTEWRIKHTGLDGAIDILYSAPDHDLPKGVSIEHLRKRDASEYGLKVTDHRHVPRDAWKPNVAVLRSILEDCRRSSGEAVYVGDSLIKDIAMAQSAGVMAAHAKYGEAQHRPEYELLRRVSHWSERDVQREKGLPGGEIVPTLTCERNFGELLSLFGLQVVAS